jgi:aminopeptidase 2
VNEIFDSISYAKGSAIIRMLEDFLGAGRFDQGIRSYLTSHQYQNASTADLWAALEGESGASITGMMNGWTQQEGYPAITVEELAHTIEGDDSMASTTLVRRFKLVQRRFTKGAAAAVQAAADNTLWQIPIVVLAGGGGARAEVQVHRYMITDREQVVEIPTSEGSLTADGTPTGWIKFNGGQSGFYRVNMAAAPSNQAALLVGLSTQALTPLDRLGLISDAFAFAATSVQSGNKPPHAAAAALKLAAACACEEDLYVWKELAGHLKMYLAVFTEDGVGDQLKALVVDTIGPTADRLGWTAVAGEAEMDTLLRTVALGLLAATQHQPTVAEALRQFEQGSYASDLRSMVLNLVVRTGGRPQWEAVRALYLSSTHPEEKRDALSAMACSTDKAIQLETFEFALSPAVRGQDINAVLRATPASATAAWEFFTDRISDLKAAFGEGQSFILSAMVKGVCAGFKTAEEAEMVLTFFATHASSLPSAKRAISQAVEAIEMKATFYADNRADVAGFFA